jgi:hypothetical protein
MDFSVREALIKAYNIAIEQGDYSIALYALDLMIRQDELHATRPRRIFGETGSDVA